MTSPTRKKRKLRTALVKRCVAYSLQLRCSGSEGSTSALRRAVGVARRALRDGCDVSAECEDALKGLALNLILSKDTEAAEKIITRYLGCTYRLSDDVFFHVTKSPPRFARGLAYDDALPHALLLGLIEAFGGEEFWKAHSYSSFKQRSFFSYKEILGDMSTVTGLAAVQVGTLYSSKFPQIRRAKSFEWWAHRRLEGSGHQLHFDSADEGQVPLRHPLVSSVIFLDDRGGPTLVTSLRPNDTELNLVDQKAFMVFPKTNRMMAFEGDRAHCVLPSLKTSPSRRRTTLMIAFWDHDDISSSPLPTEGKWTIPFRKGLPKDAALARPLPITLPPPPATVWKSLESEQKERVPLPPYEQCFQGF